MTIYNNQLREFALFQKSNQIKVISEYALGIGIAQCNNHNFSSRKHHGL